MRVLASSLMVFALLLPLRARADVIGGNAAQVPGFSERHASEVQIVGPLADSLQGKPAIVRIHADWCPACRATQSTIDKAQQLGLTKFFNATKTATSTVAVIDPRNGHVYQTFYSDGQLDEYRKVIDAAITDKSR
jgi:hypothetical protein